MHTPRVTVLMSVYNDEAHVREAIESILHQTFTDFEFLIIDDHSTDESSAIIASYANTDKRIRVIRNPENFGLTVSLNSGLENSHGEYIARMDSDDISISHRLAAQVHYMDAHQMVGVCGSWANIIGDRSGLWKNPLSNNDMKSQMLFSNSFIFPSVMLRRSVLEKHNLRFDTAYTCSQDYELWSRLSEYTEFATLPQALISYRARSGSITGQKAHIQRENTNKIKRRLLESMPINFSDEEFFLHTHARADSTLSAETFFNRKRLWLEKLLHTNDQVRRYDRASFRRILGRQWMTLCMMHTKLGFSTWVNYWASPLRHLSAKDFFRSFILLARCLLHT